MKNIRNLVMAFGLFALLGVTMAQTTYAVDLAHSHAYFRADHLGISYTFGRFNEMDASLTYNADDVASSSIEFMVLTESVDTNNDRRNGHLVSPDFFNAAQFPTLNFVSTNVADAGDDMLEVTGDLTIHGVTNEVTIMVEKTGEAVNQNGQPLIGFYTEFDINRTDYGMSNLLQATGEDVRIMLSFEGVAN